MTDPQQAMMESIAMNYLLVERSFSEPNEVAARASAEPQQMYVELQARCPVRDLGDNMYAALRLEDVRFLNKHHGVEQASKYLGSDRPAIPLGLDGPEHRKYRRLLDPVFALKRIATLEEPVRQLADEMIESFVADGTVDAYSVWCEPLPSTIFLRIMGLPMEDLESFLHFKRLTLGGDPNADLTIDQRLQNRGEAVVWIQSYFNAELDRRESAPPQEDIIGWLLATEVEGDRLDRRDLLDILGLLMIAGLDTVAGSLACILSYFARHPEQRARIVADPSLMGSAVEELMRFESPVTEGMRLTTEEITLPSGTVLPAGANVLVSWSSANLDAATFPDPLTVDFERSPNPHIAFASGFHRCLGSHLARLELVTALNVWHARIPEYSIAPGVELVYGGNPRAPHQLPLVWG